MHAIWGLGLLSLTKAVVVVDEWVDVHDYEEVFFRVGANVDPKRDVLICEGPLDHLDHAPTLQFYGGKLGIDATHKGPEEGARPWPAEIEMSDEIAALVDERWDEYGLGGARERTADATRQVVAPTVTSLTRPDLRRLNPVRLNDREAHRVEDRPGDDQQPQLPPPSLWPVGFAVGIVCLLVGLVVSWWVAAVGAALALVFGFLWARDVTTGGQAAPGAGAGRGRAAHEGEAGCRARARRALPAQQFLEGATLGLGALIGAIVTLPALGLRAPARVPQAEGAQGRPRPAHRLRGEPVEGRHLHPRSRPGRDLAPHGVHPQQRPAERPVPSFTIISNRCAHVGCPVQPGGPVFDEGGEDDQDRTTATCCITPVLPAAGFICPCHGGSYDQEGNRIAGPPVRGLDRYEFDIVNGRLVLGDLYSVAKVEGAGKTAKIEKVELARPGPARRRPRVLALPAAAAALMAATQSEQQQAPGRRSMYPLDWLEERSGLVGGRQVLPLPQGPGRLELVAHARLGDADRLPRPARDRRDPRDVLQARRRQRRTPRSSTSRTTSGAAGSCAACTAGARASSSS